MDRTEKNGDYHKFSIICQDCIQSGLNVLNVIERYVNTHCFCHGVPIIPKSLCNNESSEVLQGDIVVSVDLLSGPFYF